MKLPNKKRTAICILVSLVANCFFFVFAQKTDEFSGIALQKLPDGDRSKAAELNPIPLPPIELEAFYSNPQLSLPPRQNKDYSQQQFRADLQALKKQYAPFLQDRTPYYPTTRVQTELQQFQFRMEIPSDENHFESVLKGAGTWDTVCIPHYVGKVGWWKAYYRTFFTLPERHQDSDRHFLCFNAVDYKCQIYLNGRMIKAHEGFFAPFEVDITPFIKCDEENSLVIILENESIHKGVTDAQGKAIPDGDKIYAAAGVGWDDPDYGWHICPPGAGIWQKVFLDSRPELSIGNLYVRPDIDKNLFEARIEVNNPGKTNQNIRMFVSVYGKNFETPPIEYIPVVTKPAGPGLNEYTVAVYLDRFKLWETDSPYLYTLRVRLENDVQIPDIADIHFGMRKFTMDTTDLIKGLSQMNNHPIILRGANSMGNFEHASEAGEEALIQDILIAKLANLNFVRMTQRVVPKAVYDMCDRLGLLTQSDLPLFGYLRRPQMEEALRQTGELAKIVRNHPCNVMISFINEPFETKPGVRSHRHLSRRELHRFFKAAQEVVHVHHPDQVIKPVDGEYDPPSYGFPDNHCYNTWYGAHALPIGKFIKGYWVGNKPHWKYGCGEYGAEGLEDSLTMYRYYPAHWLNKASGKYWYPNQIAMAQTWMIHPLWFDGQHTLSDWIMASQNHQAWAIRTATRAFRRQSDRITSTCVHLLIDAWPAGWMKSLVDVDRNIKPAYGELKDALNPLITDIRTDRLRYFSGEKTAIEFWVCNDKASEIKEGTLFWELTDQSGKTLFKQSKQVDIPSYGVKFMGHWKYTTPTSSVRSTLTVRLGLRSAKGIVIHQTEQKIEIFPAKDTTTHSNITVGIVGKRGGRAWQLAQNFNLQPVSYYSDSAFNFVIIDRIEGYEAVAPFINDYVQKGGLVICLSQQPNEKWTIDTLTIRVNKLSLNSSPKIRTFVSRKTGHPIVAGCLPHDFSLWYNKKADYIDAITETWLDGPQLQPILTTGLWDWNIYDRTIVPVSASLPFGDGMFVFSQIFAEEDVLTEPMAYDYLKRIFDWANYTQTK